jgi:Zn-dependent peptidase ImmA (M78 family)
MMRFGALERFALEFELVPDPDAAGDPALRASWGRLRIWVAGRNLTGGSIPEGDRVSDAECPLLPLAEWLIDHWDPMLHEERLPTPLKATSSAAWYARSLDELEQDADAVDEILDARREWWMDHGLGAALPGYRIPDVHFRRSGELIELSWDDSEWRTVPSGIVLSELPGVTRLPVAEVVGVLESWCRSLLAALAASPDAAVQARPLAFLARLDDLRSAQRTLNRLRFAAGQKIERMAGHLRKVAGVAEGNLQDTMGALLGVRDGIPGYYAVLTAPVLLFRSAAPELSDTDLHALIALCDEAPEREPSADFQRARRAVACPLSREETTQEGYDLALELRRSLGIPDDAALTGQHEIERLFRERLGVSIVDCSLSDEGVEGAALLRPGHVPVVAVNPRGRFARTRWGRRMTLGHEICHVLHDGESDAATVGIVSNDWAPYLIERRANAFAVMFLAPEPAIERVLERRPRLWNARDLEHAMRELGIGATTLLQQLRNLHWISDRERDAWLDELTMRS